jgi:hypothetical protein
VQLTKCQHRCPVSTASIPTHLPCQQDAAFSRIKGHHKPWGFLCADLLGPQGLCCDDLSLTHPATMVRAHARASKTKSSMAANVACTRLQHGPDTPYPVNHHCHTRSHPLAFTCCSLQLFACGRAGLQGTRSQNSNLYLSLNSRQPIHCREMAGVSTPFLAHSTEQISDDTTRGDQTPVHEDVSDGLMICRCEPDRTADQRQARSCCQLPAHGLCIIACIILHIATTRDLSCPRMQWLAAGALQ